MKGKTVLYLLLFYISMFFWGSGLFIILFHTPLFARVDVFFYRGLLLLITSSAACLFMAIFLRRHIKGSIINPRDIVMIITIIFSINLVVFTLLPVTVERSISVFILESMKPHKNYSRTEIEGKFTEEYTKKNNAIQKRFHEQIVSKNIEYENGRYNLTPQGLKLVEFFNTVKVLFRIK